MKSLYTNILPLKMNDGQDTIVDYIQIEFQKADSVDIAVGYISEASLIELDRLVDSNNLKRICLVMGMYYSEGIPENTYHQALRINSRWRDAGVGEIRLVRPFKYHGKAYSFIKNGKPTSAVIGSANLSVLKPDAGTLRQYEFAGATEDPEECSEIHEHILSLEKQQISLNIADVHDINIIRAKNTSLNDIELVAPVPENTVELYKKHLTKISFTLPLKVPAFTERFMDDGKHYTKSNINVCYAAPRSAKKNRDWFETQLTVEKRITALPGYPEKNKPFFVVTDDGFWFKAHTTSDGNKQFSAVGDELIMGRWLKGRLAASGLVKPVNDTGKDTDRIGMITREMLEEYGADSLVFTKTDQKALDPDDDSKELDVWYLSFEKIS